MCYMEPNCVSINVRPSQGGKYKCELNNATADVISLENWDTAYYLAVEVNCILAQYIEENLIDKEKRNLSGKKEEELKADLTQIFCQVETRPVHPRAKAQGALRLGVLNQKQINLYSQQDQSKR